MMAKHRRKVGEIVPGKGYVFFEDATPDQQESFKSMLLSQQPPGVDMPGSSFFRSAYARGQFQRTPEIGEQYAEEARRRGVSTYGKYYSHQLADYAGDPSAWVSDVDDFKRVAAAKGVGCEPLGLKAVKKGDDEAPVVLDEKIIQQEIINRCLDDPSLQKRDVRDLREEVIEKHKPHWSE
jgi:hypothetical protein